jgi:hypothetical protein
MVRESEVDVSDVRRCCRKHETEDLSAKRPADKFFDRLFIVFPTCGNKRCPKASDCSLECTGSNLPGQVGSRFEKASEFR